MTLTRDEKIFEFISFCIENFKAKFKMKGKEVANLFYESGVTDFLIESYDLLHTQGNDYILSEIEIFLKNRGYKL
ncbi:DUF3791 domain-containing protein [Clostridium botulinum]